MDRLKRKLLPAHNLIGAAFLLDLLVAMTSLAVQNLGIYRLDAPPLVLGLFATGSSLAYTLGCLVSGSISDRTGRRRCAVIACLGAGAAWVLLPHTTSWGQVLWIVPLVGASLSLFWPSLQAWLAELVTAGGAHLGKTLSLFNIMWAAGLMIGPVVTGYLWPVSYQLTFYLPAAGMAIIVIMILVTPRGTSDEHGTAARRAEPHPDNGLFLILAWIGNFASFFATRTISAMFPRLGHDLGLSTSLIGWLLFAVGAGQITMFIYTRYNQRWQYKLWPMMAAQFAAALGLIMVVFTGSQLLFALGFALAGVSAGITYVSSLFYALDGRSRDKGKTSGFHEAVLGSGVFLGPLLGGVAAQHLDLRAPFAIAASVLALACAAQVWLAGSVRDRRDFDDTMTGNTPVP